MQTIRISTPRAIVLTKLYNTYKAFWTPLPHTKSLIILAGACGLLVWQEEEGKMGFSEKVAFSAQQV